MSNLSSVASLELFNFRCHPDGRIGPFRRFNLLYGRNGSGKTSLLEAIEVGITCGSSRLQMGDAVEVLTRSKGKSLIITVSGGAKGVINTFKYRNGRAEAKHSQSELLERIYGLSNVDGRKARYLLPQLFRTHNILYSDRIVQFLQVSEKKELKKVFSELTMGTVPVEVWQRITMASEELIKLQKEYTSDLQDLEKRADMIKNDMADVDASGRSQLAVLSGQLLRDLPVKLREKLGPELNNITPSRRAIAAIRSVVLELQGAVKQVGILRIFSDVHDVEITEDNLRRQLSQLRELKKHIRIKNDDHRQELERISISVRRNIQRVRTLTPTLKEKEEERTRLLAVRATTQDLIEWIPELAAEEKAKAYGIQKSMHERILGDLNTGMATVKGLPVSNRTVALKKRKRQLRKDSRAITKKIEYYRTELQGYKHDLAAYDKRLVILKSQNRRIYKLVSRLAQAATNLDAKGDRVECPLCGSHWVQRDRFLSAVDNQLAKLAEGVDPVELGRRAQVQRKSDQTRDWISGEQKKLSSIQEDVGRIEGKLVNVEEKTARLADLCANLGITEDRFKVLIRDRNALEDMLHQQIQKQQQSLRSLRRRKKNLWERLREHEFKERRNKLRAKLTELTRNVDQWKLPVPGSWEYSLWRKMDAEVKRLQKEVHQELTHTGEKLRIVDARLANLRGTRREVRTGLADLRDKNEEVTRQLESTSGALNALEALRDAGFVESGRRIVPRIVDNALNHALVTVTSIVKELEAQFDNEHTLAVIQKQLKEIDQERENSTREYRTCTRILKKIAQAPSVETLQRNVWNKYSKAIGNIFRKLHWPPDYDNVVVDEGDDNWEVLLARRREPRTLVPAHQQMSSGQRAALAISVFWSFNTSPNVPSVLLMDEPIQNIDDMNMLNFLDGLRWLVEDTDRQVFVTTANRRVETLVRRKFSYLKDDYLEIYLSRGAESLTNLEYYDWRGKRLGGEEAIA